MAVASAIAISVAAGSLLWIRPPAGSLSFSQILELLPPGTSVHSFARVDLDGRRPQEVAVVAGLPSVPGGRYRYYEFILRYDPWRRRMARVYSQPLSGPLALSVDAVRHGGNRDAVVFVALHDDGTRTYRVVGVSRGRVRVLHEGAAPGGIIVADPLLIEMGSPPRALAWNGRGFVHQPFADTVPVLRPTFTWRYRVRHAAVSARTSLVHVAPRQILRLSAAGGGTGAIVIPDSRFDVVENGGFRARAPGIYRVRLVIPFAPEEAAYVLTVIVE